MNDKTRLPELLCPAGSPEAFSAAIEGGADAIYVGGTAFNARMNAKNFTVDELREAIKLAHAYGVKVYVATNTLVYDNEMNGMLRAAEDAYLCGADALIVADVGAAVEIKKRIPIDLHASTQMSGHNAAAARYLEKMGFSRMVCAREMSRDDLRTFVSESPIEAEVFVHGALCVCHSGQCLFSSLVGGRSGNRGECAQPCRLPFKNGRGGYPISLKDLSLAEHIPELTDMGIASFKIEGRMKSPEYVRDVAAIWRRLIDEGRGADKSDMKHLAEIFSRGGFTDGYYNKNIGRGMLGVRSEGDKEATRALTPFERITRKIPVELSAELRVGEPVRLTARTEKKCVTVFGAIPEEARTAPLNGDAVKKNLLKLGSTPYMATDADIKIDGQLILPLSAINALRRSAVDELMKGENRRAEDIKTDIQKSDEKYNKINGHSAYFHFPERIPDNAREYFDVIYLPLEKYGGETNGIALPPVIFDSEREKIRESILRAVALGCKHALVGNAGHIELLSGTGLCLHGNLGLNVANTETAKHYAKEFEDLILSPELTLPKIRDISRACPRVRVQIYGRTPLMVTEKCVGKELSSCEACTEGRTTLTDRRGVEFPVLRGYDHRSIIVNSVPTYMADRRGELKSNGDPEWHFIFTVETKAEAEKVVESYKKGIAPNMNVRRVK